MPYIEIYTMESALKTLSLCQRFKHKLEQMRERLKGNNLGTYDIVF